MYCTVGIYCAVRVRANRTGEAREGERCGYWYRLAEWRSGKEGIEAVVTNINGSQFVATAQVTTPHRRIRYLSNVIVLVTYPTLR